MANLFGQLPPFDVNNDIPKSFLNVLQELYHDGRLTSWKVRGRGDILSVRLTWFDPDHRNACIKAKARQHLAELDELDDEDDLGYGTFPTSESNDPGSLISQVGQDKNIKRELKEFGTRLHILVEKLQGDLAERNTYNNHQSVRGKISTIIRRGGKESLKIHQQHILAEITRARVAVSGPLRRSTVKTDGTHERNLQDLLVQQTEIVLQTNLQQFHKSLTASNSSISASHFDQQLAQTIFDKCVSREIFHELPTVIDGLAPPKPQRQSSNTSSLTSLTKPSFFQPTWSNSSPRSSTSWEIKSRNDNIQKVNIEKNSTISDNQGEDTEKEDEQEQTINNTNKFQPITTTESIEFDNGLKLDLSSIDGDISSRQNINQRHSIDSDFDAINKSDSRVGDWQTNFTLIEPKSSSHSGEDTSRSTRETLFLTIPTSNNKDLSPRVGDKPLEDLGDDDLYADDESSSYPIPINTTTIGEQSQISDNESINNKKLFPFPANLVLQNHSSCSFRRPSYTYESDTESVTSILSNMVDMRLSIDEEKFRMDPNIVDPKFILRPRDTTTRYGETAKFKTQIQGTEPIDVFWFRFGTDDEIINDEKYQLSHDDTYHYLKIYSTNQDDQGAYLCVIANDKAQNVDMIKLSIKDNKRSFTSPKILQGINDTDVNEGSSLTLTCKLDQGYPKARVLWYKENSLIIPNQHYKLYYYGDGQHALHVDEATIEDDNGTFTCLALNAAGRVQITADVFVHEKEVINIPRDSPLIKHDQQILPKRKSNKEILNMNHNENDLPKISPPISPLTKHNLSDNDERNNAKRFMDRFKNERTNKLFENWQNLYEASVQSLQSDDDEQLKSPKQQQQQQPFYLNRHSSIEKSLEERARSPFVQSHTDSNMIKSKWEIRLPQLLNTTVGPDRQKRDLTRRHTTNNFFQQEQQQPSVSNPSHKESNLLSQSLTSSEMSNDIDDDRPLSPLVKQLRQKFDRMTSNISTNEFNKNHSQSQTGLSKINRVGNDDGDGAYPLLPVASLTCRGLTSNSGERSVQKPRPMLPIRPSPEITPTKSKTSNNESLNHDTTSNTTNHSQRGKTKSSINNSKKFSSAPSTTSVVKKLLGGGATLVYDSLTSDNISLHTTPSLLQHHYYPNHHHHQQQRKDNVRNEQIKSTTNNNLLILTENSSYNTKLISTKNQNNSVNSDDETNHQHYSISIKDSLNRSISMSDNLTIPAKSNDPMLNSSSNRSITPVGRNSVLARAELWDRRISTNETETNTSIITYDIEQWSNEFEKIQNQN